MSALWQGAGGIPQQPNPLSQLPQTNIVVREDRAVEATVPIATTGSMETLVTPRWQLIVHEKRGAQLYDRSSDPEEAHDLAPTPEGRAVLPDLLKELETRTKDPTR